MKTKPKLILCLLLFLLGGVLNLFFSTAFHSLLTHEISMLAFSPIGACIESLVANEQHFLLFLCIQGFFLILAVLFFITNMYPYKSDLEQITPDIKTPRSVGQFQHGSARWMTDEEKDNTFNSYLLNPHNKVIKALIDSGYDDISPAGEQITPPIGGIKEAINENPQSPEPQKFISEPTWTGQPEGSDWDDKWRHSSRNETRRRL